MAKHYKKQVVRRTEQVCISCSKRLTTIDICYSNTAGKCWPCDRAGVQTSLFSDDQEQEEKDDLFE